MAKTGLDFSAYIAERTRDFAGREWVFAEIDRWLADPTGPRFFIVIGEPGIGKSAIATQLSKIRKLAASHFCIARQADTIDSLGFAYSIAQQLCKLPEYAQHILEEQNIHIDIYVQENYGQIIGAQIANLVNRSSSGMLAFNRTVVEPLKALHLSGYKQQLLVLVDGLDEAIRQVGDENIIDLLTNARGLPETVRFLLTTRPDSSILDEFEMLDSYYLNLESNKVENQRDIRSYITHKLSASSSLQVELNKQQVEIEDFINKVVSSSNGNFLYLTSLLRSISNETQIAELIKALPSGLDGIYRDFLRTRKFGKLKDQWRDRDRPLLGLLSVAPTTLTVENFVQLSEINLQIVKDFLLDFQQFLDPQQAYLGQYRLYHQAFADFLGNPHHAGKTYCIDQKEIHSQITERYWDKFSGDWSTCDEYGLRYLVYHLCNAQKYGLLFDLLERADWYDAQLKFGYNHNRRGITG